MNWNRDERIFMTGAVIGAMLGSLSDLVTFPWWIVLPLTIAGAWVVFDLVRAWFRAFKSKDSEV